MSTVAARAQAFEVLRAAQRESSLADALRLAVEAIRVGADLLEKIEAERPVAREVASLREVAAWCEGQAKS